MNNKFIKFLTIVLSMVIFIGVIYIHAIADDGIKVKLNGALLAFDVPPQTIKDRTMVPMRKIFEALGATVEWDEQANTATAVKDDDTIVIAVDSMKMTKNGQEIALDVPARLINDRMLVPVRAVSEGLGATVAWDENTRQVDITNEAPEGVVTPELTWLPEDGSMMPDEQETKYFEYVKTVLGADKVVFDESLLLPENKLAKDEVVADLNGDGEEELLHISATNDFITDPDTATNKPIKLTFQINGLTATYENEWNDNVYLYMADLNPTDQYTDICLLSTGTGAGDYTTTIYRYDGKSIYQFAQFAHYMPSLYNDKKGHVYFVAMDFEQDADGLWPKGPVMKVLNMNTGECILLKNTM